MIVRLYNKYKHASYEEQGSEFAVVWDGMEREREERENF